MLVAVVGGNLQGMEVAYLARKAGWTVVVADNKPAPPAKGLCDRFVQIDVSDTGALQTHLKGVDLIVPALEDAGALRHLDQWTRRKEIPFAFDFSAYQTSSSKLTSNQLFRQTGIAQPTSWPDCGFPLLAKPDMGSGSRRVTILHEAAMLQRHRQGSDEKWVLQEYVPGPLFSIEVIGKPGLYAPLLVTDLEMDAEYDCKRVLAPTRLADEHIFDFEKMGTALAEALTLRGLMDVEVVLAGNTLKVLEIDARFPSQTPIAVFWSSGVNMVQMLGELFLDGSINYPQQKVETCAVILEHICVNATSLTVAGEHIMSGQDPMQIVPGFYGADEAITNYAPGRRQWVATLILRDKDRATVWQKRQKVMAEIQAEFGLRTYLDPAPENPGD